jgi:hypothetical protein
MYQGTDPEKIQRMSAKGGYWDNHVVSILTAGTARTCSPAPEDVLLMPAQIRRVRGQSRFCRREERPVGQLRQMAGNVPVRA